MVVVFLFSAGMDKVLLMLENKGLYAGMWNGIGGKVEAGQFSYVSGALRYVLEKTDIQLRASDLPYLMTCSFAMETAIHVFTGLLNETETSQCKGDEMIWVSLEDILSMPVTDSRLAMDGSVPFFINVAAKHLRNAVISTASSTNM
jgi:ADP-ribose pyrophosphatase YjhB (NUDIX family)